jgi:hypothetical protein
MCASIFPASKAAEGDIRILLGRAATAATHETIKDYAQFAFVRFCSRCDIGPAMEVVTIDFLFRILKDVDSGHLTFGASIGEQIYNQRRLSPSLMIPSILQTLTTVILEKGGVEAAELFRRPPNRDVMDNLIAAINRGGEARTLFSSVEVIDIAALLPRWLHTLPGHLIPANATSHLVPSADPLSILEELPPGHVLVLKFICGFLGQLARCEGAQVTLRELVEIFAPTMIENGGENSSAVVTAIENLCLAIIENSLFADVYSVPASTPKTACYGQAAFSRRLDA